MKEKQDSQSGDTDQALTKHPIGDNISNLRQLAEQEANQIISKAYEQSAEIIGRARQEAEQIVLDAQIKTQKITTSAGAKNEAGRRDLSSMIHSGSFTEHSYERIDYLFVQMRRYIASTRKSECSISNREMRSLINELEYWVDSLVIDSLKLKSLGSLMERTAELAKKLRVKLDTK